MHKFNYICSIILVITLPLMIVILSSNLVLRMSGTYNYHFNDSQVMDEIPYNVTGKEMAEGITSYLNSFGGEAFQVYEKNGNYKDPIFEEDDQKAMKKARNIFNIDFAIGFLCFALTLAIYIYLWKGGFTKALRKRYYTGAAITAAILIGQIILWMIKPARGWIYRNLFGTLGKESIIMELIGDPFFKTYMLFATVLGVALLAVLTYVNHQLTKPERIFY
ncbi:MAG: DUF1461 domain-containing protein [Emergencia sp.]